MKKYFFIGAGGFLGAAARFLIAKSGVISVGALAANIIIINITGSFILSLFLTLASDYWGMNEEIIFGVSAGFLGAYTTFSTLCKEGVFYFIKNQFYLGIIYIFVSVTAGLLFSYLGIYIGRLILAKNK